MKYCDFFMHAIVLMYTSFILLKVIKIPESEDDERDKLHRKKKSRKNHPCPEEWVVNKNQKRREQGLAYEGLVRNEGKWKYTAPREKRKIFHDVIVVLVRRTLS